MRRILTLVALVAVVSLSGVGSAVATHLVVRSSDIVDYGIRNVDIATAAVNSRVIQNGSVGRGDLSTALQAQLQWASVPSGRTIRGAVGGDFDAAGPTPTDWGVVVSLPARARNALDDDDVYVNVTTWTSGDAGQTQPTTTDTNAGCSGSLSAPTAPAGKVCIYVAGGDNATDLNGYSVRPGTGASPYGFKLSWTNTELGDTFIDAVWAYRAP
jgi:hypothetical protein